MDNTAGNSGAPLRRNRAAVPKQEAIAPQTVGPSTDDNKKKQLPWSDWRSRKGSRIALTGLIILGLLSYFFHGLPTISVTETKTKVPTRREQELSMGISLAPTVAPAKALKVPYPIFLASFSKSGTTSTYRAFQCHLGKEYVDHRYTTNAAAGGKADLIGRCVEQNLKNKQFPFEGCGTNANNDPQTVVWTDTSYIGGDHGCFHPNLDALDDIWEAYPHATLLYVRRNATAWFHSANTKRAAFIQKWAEFCPQMPSGRNSTVWVNFYNNYTERVRNFAKQRQGQMTYVEVELEHPDTARILEEQIGLPESCWKHCKSSFTNEKCNELQHNNSNKRND
jgi:Sulfotransferase domain